jgi:hypothetical protein
MNHTWMLTTKLCRKECVAFVLPVEIAKDFVGGRMSLRFLDGFGFMKWIDLDVTQRSGHVLNPRPAWVHVIQSLRDVTYQHA